MIRVLRVLLLAALALVCVTAPAASRPLGLAADLPSPPAALSLSPPAPAEPIARAADTGISYAGGPVLHHSRTHLIFWSPSNHPELSFDPGYIALVERFAGDVARASRSTASEYGITGQYHDLGGPAAYASSYAGAVLDTDAAPASGCVEPLPPTGPGWLTCLNDGQLQAEIGRVIARDHLPAGPDDVYFLLTPKGLGDCADSASSECALGGPSRGYCGYHSVTPHNVLYAVIPYNAVSGHCQSSNPRPNHSTADPALSTLSHEQAEIVTDPLGDGWVNVDGEEIADLCIRDFGPALGGSGTGLWNETIAGDHYWLQELFSRFAGACEPRPQADRVRIAGPARAVAGKAITLVARASQPGGRIVAYRWQFGDRLGAHRHRVTVTYDRPGRHRVYLRVTDSSGNWAYATRTIRATPR